MVELLEKKLNGSRKQLAKRLREDDSVIYDEGLEF